MLIQQRSQWSASAVHVMSEALVFSIAQCLVVALDGFMWFPGEGSDFVSEYECKSTFEFVWKLGRTVHHPPSLPGLPSPPPLQPPDAR